MSEQKPVFNEKPTFPEANGTADAAALLAAAPPPMGPAAIEAFGDVLATSERALPLTDPRVLCNNCVHGWIMGEPAAVKNLRPDGSPFMSFRGICTLGPLSLTEVHPTICNKHKPPRTGWLLQLFRRKQ